MSNSGERGTRDQVFIRSSSLPHLGRAEGDRLVGEPVGTDEIREAIVALKADYKGPIKGLLGFLAYLVATGGGFLLVLFGAAIISTLGYYSPADEEGDQLYWLAGSAILVFALSFWLLVLIDRANSRIKVALVWWYDRLFEAPEVRSLIRRNSYRYVSRRELDPPYRYSDLGREMATLLLICWGPLVAIIALVGLFIPGGYGFTILLACVPLVTITFACYRRISRGAVDITRASDPAHRDELAEEARRVAEAGPSTPSA